jgi:non-heme Fe2+,alpha-ketoglutarate-dependent halogenase
MTPESRAGATATDQSNLSAHRLTDEETARFHARGYIGPFDLLEPAALGKLRPTFDAIISGKLQSPVYHRTTHRDWHLHYRNLLSICYRPEVMRRVQSLLGQDLLIWRSSIFHKAPGDGALAWHQSSLFAGEEYGIFKPALGPPPEYEVYTDMFNLSVWVALDDVTAANGAMQIAVGTQNRQYPVKKVPFAESVFGKVAYDNFARAGDAARLAQLAERYACETIFDPAAEGTQIDTVEMKKGQFFIFTDRVLHASLENSTEDQRRLAINFRVTVPQVTVYPHRGWGDMIDGNDHDISGHACVMLSGQDRFGNNIYLN